MANALTDPPFAANPPVKLNVNAKILGLVIGILALIGLILSLIALPVVFALNSVVSSYCGYYGVSCGSSGIFLLALLGVIVSIVGDILYAVGGFQMYGGNRAGKGKVIYGLIINLIGGVLQIVGYGGILGFIFSLIVAIVVYYLVVISRFPGETPLVASPSGGYGTPPPPPPA
ncbi:MAG: hypothetical protein ABR498_07140 [Candidatus Dormibacteria bacterium]